MKAHEELLENWTHSAENYSRLIQKELTDQRGQAWSDALLECVPKSGSLDILDVGTGPGFFILLMAQAGHRVTGIDCTQAMIDHAQQNVQRAHLQNVQLEVADSHDLPYADQSFDMVISRNVAWTLHDAALAFAQWHRVLRPGGVAVIFVANWNRELFDEDLKKLREADLAQYTERFGGSPHQHNDQGKAYRRLMPMCQRVRPQWDLGVLVDVGFDRIECDTNINTRIYNELEQTLYRSTPMFRIVARRAK